MKKNKFSTTRVLYTVHVLVYLLFSHFEFHDIHNYRYTSVETISFVIVFMNFVSFLLKQTGSLILSIVWLVISNYKKGTDIEIIDGRTHEHTNTKH